MYSEDDEEVFRSHDQTQGQYEKDGINSTKLSSELDFSEEIPRVESPFNRIRPSLLKSYRASKRYKDKKKMKKSKILNILSPLSPYDVQATQKRKQGVSRKDFEEKPTGSEMESEVVSSSDDISEVEGLPKTPFSVISEPNTPFSVMSEPKTPCSVMSEPKTPFSVMSEPKTPFSVMSEPPDIPSCSTQTSSVQVSPAQPAQTDDKFSLASTPLGELDFKM